MQMIHSEDNVHVPKIKFDLERDADPYVRTLHSLAELHVATRLIKAERDAGGLVLAQMADARTPGGYWQVPIKGRDYELFVSSEPNEAVHPFVHHSSIEAHLGSPLFIVTRRRRRQALELVRSVAVSESERVTLVSSRTIRQPTLEDMIVAIDAPEAMLEIGQDAQVNIEKMGKLAREVYDFARKNLRQN